MKRVLVVSATLLLGAAIAAGASAWIAWRSLTVPIAYHHRDPVLSRLFHEPRSNAGPVEANPDNVAVVIEIRPGETLRGVSRTLATFDLIRLPFGFELYARAREYDTRLQAGRYALQRTMSGVEMLERIVGGQAEFDEIIVTIPEGWSLYDIEAHFEEIGLFSRRRFEQAAVMRDVYREFPLLAPLEDDTILDGYLYPDTYRVFAESTPETIVARMLDNFHRRVPEQLLEAIAEQQRTLHEVLTLASIVQKESASDEEMPQVAGVFWNRLRRGMRLESDATVNYVLGTSKLQPTFADTEVDHPYNTYENGGLPPGPIGNPGLPAIAAAVYPADHDYLFFLHRPDRRIVLSRSFTEHLENKARYLD